MRHLVPIFAVLLAVMPLGGCALFELASDIHDLATDREAKKEAKEEEEKEAKRRAREEAREAARQRAEEEEIARKMEECREKYKDMPNIEAVNCQERYFRSD